MVNWKAILSLVYPQENWEIFQRIRDIKTEFYPCSWDVALFVYILPLGIAIIATTVLPWIVTGLDKFGYAAVVHRRNKRLEAEAKLPENVKKYMQMEALNKELQADIKSLADRFSKLQGEETRKSVGWAKCLQTIVGSDEYYRETLRKLYRETRSGLEWNDKLRLLQDLELISGIHAGAYELTDLGRSTIRSVG